MSPLPQSSDNKRPSSNVRLYVETIDSMREEADRIEALTKHACTYAQLSEEAWRLYLREKDKNPDALFSVTNYRPENLKWHDQLEEILNSHLDVISDAIQKNLEGFQEAVKAITSRWSGEPPDEHERDLVSRVLAILRSEQGHSVRRELLLALLNESHKGHKKPDKKHPRKRRR